MPKRSIAIPSFLLTCGAAAFLAASLATQNWITAEPFYQKTTQVIEGESENTQGANINVGLFIGYKYMKILETPTEKVLTIVCKDGYCIYSENTTPEARIKDLEKSIERQLSNTGLSNKTATELVFSQGLWASSVAFVCMALLMAVVGAVFSIVNAVMNPIELITSITGLHIWNILGGTFGAIALILWAVLYSNSLTHNILSLSDLDGQWTSKDTAAYGFSYWFVFISVLFFIINGAYIMLKVHKPCQKKIPKIADGNSSHSGQMLY